MILELDMYSLVPFRCTWAAAAAAAAAAAWLVTWDPPVGRDRGDIFSRLRNAAATFERFDASLNSSSGLFERLQLSLLSRSCEWKNIEEEREV